MSPLIPILRQGLLIRPGDTVESVMLMDDSRISDTTRSRCAYYRNVCGIPAGIDPEFDRIIVRAGVIGAITMSAELGACVQDAMRYNRCTLGSIISHSKSCRWTFLVRSDISAEDIGLFAETFRKVGQSL